MTGIKNGGSKKRSSTGECRATSTVPISALTSISSVLRPLSAPMGKHDINSNNDNKKPLRRRSAEDKMSLKDASSTLLPSNEDSTASSPESFKKGSLKTVEAPPGFLPQSRSFSDETNSSPQKKLKMRVSSESSSLPSTLSPSHTSSLMASVSPVVYSENEKKLVENGTVVTDEKEFFKSNDYQNIENDNSIVGGDAKPYFDVHDSKNLSNKNNINEKSEGIGVDKDGNTDNGMISSDNDEYKGLNVSKDVGVKGDMNHYELVANNNNDENKIADNDENKIADNDEHDEGKNETEKNNDKYENDEERCCGDETYIDDERMEPKKNERNDENNDHNEGKNETKKNNDKYENDEERCCGDETYIDDERMELKKSERNDENNDHNEGKNETKKNNDKNENDEERCCGDETYIDDERMEPKKSERNDENNDHNEGKNETEKSNDKYENDEERCCGDETYIDDERMEQTKNERNDENKILPSDDNMGDNKEAESISNSRPNCVDKDEHTRGMLTYRERFVPIRMGKKARIPKGGTVDGYKPMSRYKNQYCVYTPRSPPSSSSSLASPLSQLTLLSYAYTNNNEIKEKKKQLYQKRKQEKIILQEIKDEEMQKSLRAKDIKKQKRIKKMRKKEKEKLEHIQKGNIQVIKNTNKIKKWPKKIKKNLVTVAPEYLQALYSK